MSLPEERLAFTYSDTAELLHLSESTVRTLVREGQLESVLIRRCRRIPRDAILALLDANRCPSRAHDGQPAPNAGP